jgi:hypothetical protein
LKRGDRPTATPCRCWLSGVGDEDACDGSVMEGPDRGGGGIGRRANQVAARKPRPAEGGGRGGRRWPSGAGLAGVVDDQVGWCSSRRRSGSGRSERGHAAAERRSKRCGFTREKTNLRVERRTLARAHDFGLCPLTSVGCLLNFRRLFLKSTKIS